MRQARAVLRGSMHAFSEAVRQDVVSSLRELFHAATKEVKDLVVAVEGRVKSKVSVSGFPDSSAGASGVERYVFKKVWFVTEVLDEVADESANAGEV